MTTPEPLWDLMGVLFKSHPWHGIAAHSDDPDRLTCYIEMVPTDTVKYELDKVSGLLSVDRPQAYSNVCPSLYGLVPRTYCGPQVARRCSERLGRADLVGDGDPLDVCVLTERTITHGNILVAAKPIGGLRMLDGSEVDDKIVAVLVGDASYGALEDISDCPPALINRLVHYFETYKRAPGADTMPCEIAGIYGRDEALDVIRLSRADYADRFRDLQTVLDAAWRA
jgi:inorganic pyrophosphatase